MVQFAVGTNRLTARTLSRHRHLFGGIALTSALLGFAGAPPAIAEGSAEQQLAERYAPLVRVQEQTDACGDGSVIATAPTAGDLAAAAVSPPAAS